MLGADPLLGRDPFAPDAVSGAVAAFNSALAERRKGLPGLRELVARPCSQGVRRWVNPLK
ncbi:hypothetical protein GCM10010276_27230 [Streptomyces longisporus]|uniref:Uncharacterized protein n=1 Tax=Streptomyces longisporus TaxID=1948 RepID=A0ABP5Z1A8_STRLO